VRIHPMSWSFSRTGTPAGSRRWWEFLIQSVLCVPHLVSMREAMTVGHSTRAAVSVHHRTWV
jgi:hypothetical protein